MSSQADILIKIYPRYHTIIAFYNVALGITFTSLSLCTIYCRLPFTDIVVDICMYTKGFRELIHYPCKLIRMWGKHGTNCQEPQTLLRDNLIF